MPRRASPSTGWASSRARSSPSAAPGKQLLGFSTALLLDEITLADAMNDPAMAALRECVAANGPLRPGERLMHHRYFVGRDGYQDLATHNMHAMVATSRWLTTPRLAYSFGVVAEPERWQPMFDAIRFRHDPLADFEVGGRHYGVFMHDWRIDPPRVWIESQGRARPACAQSRGAALAAPVVVLSEPDFEAAVRQALRDLHQPMRSAPTRSCARAWPSSMPTAWQQPRRCGS